jgi:hypothetical protein
MSPEVIDSRSAELIQQMGLEKLFAQDRLLSDLRQGELWNPAKTRLALLSTDLLAGIYRALQEEAGPAWSLIFKSCGRIWGRRVAQRLDRECQTISGQGLASMNVETFLKFVENYFAFHGWGVVNIDISKTAQAGIVEASLDHSVFLEIVDDPEQMSDSLIAGVLASLFGFMSGHELDSLQTEDARFGAERSRFIISDPKRIEAVEPTIGEGATHEQIIEQI